MDWANWINILPILAFIALAAGLAVVFRRTGSIVARTREAEGFRSSVRDLAARVDASLAGASTRIDQVRHHQLTPDAIAETLTIASDAVDRYLAEARALHAPASAVEVRDSLITQLERAGRALATVEHGTTIMSTVRGGARELEAQTSIKRGYLNLLHAREAIATEASRADGLLSTRRDHTM